MTPPPSLLSTLSEDSESLHVSHIKRVAEFPPSYDFYRNSVSKSVPLVITNGFDIKEPETSPNNNKPTFHPALTSLQTLSTILNDDLITVNVTPSHGKGDAIFDNTFVTPEEREMKFREFVDKLHLSSKDGDNDDDSAVFYYSSQDDNLRSNEAHRLSSLLPPTLPSAEEAFNTGPPQAVNIWIGDGRATTVMHRDVYENVYCVLTGMKRFVLVPPYMGGCLYEKTFKVGTFKENRVGTGDFDVIKGNVEDEVKDWVSVDVEDDKRNPNFPLTNEYVKPIVVDVFAGESLYLPSMWYHKVSSIRGEVTVAVNYWFDMEYDGVKWMLVNFVNGVGRKGGGGED